MSEHRTRTGRATTPRPADLRALVERAVACHLRPSMQCEPHPDEIAIVDAVMDVVAPHGPPANAAHHRRLRCAMQASHPWVNGIYACGSAAAQTVLVPLATADGAFAGKGVRVGVCRQHARELVDRYGAIRPTPSFDGIAGSLQDLSIALAGMTTTLEEIRANVARLGAASVEESSDG